MIQKITNLTSGKSITMETRFVRLPSTYNNVKYMTKVTSNDVMFVKLTFNNLQSYDKLINGKIKIDIKTTTETSMDFFLCVVNENVDLVDQGRLFSLAQNLNSNNSINDSTFVRNLGYTGFQPHEIDITNALSMVSNTNNSVLLIIGNKSSLSYSASDTVVNSPSYSADSSVTCEVLTSEKSGLASIYKYDNYSVGNATGYINVATGRMIQTMNLYSGGGKKLPINLSLIFNEFKTTNNSVIGGFYCDFDFVGKIKVSGNTIYLTDATENMTTFEKVNNTSDFAKLGIIKSSNHSGYSGVYFDEVTKKYLFTNVETYNGASVNVINLYDQEGNLTKYRYSTSLIRLLQIKDKYGNYINYSWDSSFSKVNSITSSDGDVLTFAYDSSSRISYIYSTKFDRKIIFTYSSSTKLVIYQDCYNSTLTKKIYNVEINFSTIRITQIKDLLTNDELNYVRDGNYRISQVSFKNGDFYLYKNTYSYFDSYTRVTDYKGNRVDYYFDAFGRVKFITDKEGICQNYVYDYTYKNVALLMSSPKLTTHSRNLLENGEFESPSGWTFNNFSGTSSYSIDSLGRTDSCLKITKTSSSSVSLQKYIYNVYDGKFCLKGFIKCVPTSSTTNKGIIVEVSGSYVGSSGTVTFSSTYDSFMWNGEWEEFITPSIEIPTGVTSVSILVKVTFNFNSGTVYLDDFKFANPKHLSKVNLIKNGYMDFYTNLSSGYTGWNSNCGYTQTTRSSTMAHVEALGKYVIKIPYSASPVIKRVYTTINKSGKSNEKYLFSVYGKCYVDLNTNFKSYVKVNYTNGESKTYSFDFAKYDSNWQVLTNNFVTENSYTSIEAGVEYDGSNEVEVDCFQLYQDDNGGSSVMRYSEKGKLSVLSNDQTSMQIVYDDLNRVKKVFNTDGSILDYAYTSDNRISTIKDNFGKTITYTYSNGFVTNVQYKEGVSYLNESYTNDSSGNCKTFVDINGIISTMGYDSKNRMLTKVLGNSEMYNYGYSNDDVLKQVSVVDTFNITNNISYDSRLNPSNINNGSLRYAFTYDIFGRLITVIQNGSFVIRNNYLVRTINGEQFATNILTSSTYDNGDYYQYSYDDNDYLIEIKLNGKVIVTYINDEFGNVVSSQKYGYDKNGNLTETVKRKYLYDCGQLIEVIDEKVTIKTLVDKGMLKKVNYIYNDSSRSIDYIDGGEVSELGMNGYVGRLANLFNDEILMPELGFKGIFGGTYSETVGTFTSVDSTVGFSYVSYSQSTDYTTFALENLHPTSDQAKWLKDMETQKTFYAWVKPTAKFALSNIFKLLSGSSTSKVEECRLDIVDDGSLLYTSANNNATISFNQKVTLNDWNLISLTMYGSETSSTTYIKMSVNGVCSSASSVPEKVSNIKFFRVCDCAENDVEVIEESSSSSVEETNYTEEEMISLLSSTTSTSLSMPIRVWLVGVGSYDYSNNDIMGIYKVGKKFLNSNLFKPSIYQGTVYYNFGLYKDYEVASLNGTFETSKGRKPIEMVDFDNSYKNNKLRSFFLDNKKFVYGSYDGSLKETMTPQLKQILGYDFDIDSTGKFVLRFKIDSSIDTSSNRTIVSFGNGSSDALRIDLTNNSLIISSFETVKKSVSISISKDEWHSLFIDYSTSKIYVCIDGVRYDGDSLTSISLSSLKTYIGVSKVKNTRLNGLVEMVGYSRTNNSGVVNDILSEAEQLTNEGGTTYHHNIVNALGKVTSKIIENSNNTFETNYSYNSNSNLINLEEKTTGYTGNYLYDSNGNLKSYYTNFQSSSYSYDKLGRLVAEDDSSTQISINYTYDNDGNIKTKEITETNVDDILITYTYDTTIKDRLIGVTNSSNGSNISIQYDSDGRFGYPIKIGNDTLVWEGKNLKSYGNMTFYYNDQGIRYKKVNTTTGATTEYILCGDKVIRMIKGNIIFDFVYDVNDMVIGLSFNGLEYIYDRDIFGNIVGIVDKDNSYIVKYKYDAFGHMTELDASSDTNASIVIENNPFYYKGYLYDVETQLYWVSSRYYSPELCRWISPDSIEYLDPESINGLNLYAYCGNDPVNKYDPTGHFALTATALVWIAFGVSAFVGATASVISQGIETDWQNINVLQVIWDAGIAGIGGALSMSPLGWGAMIAANTALGFVGSVGVHLIKGHDLFGANAGEYWTDIGISTLIGAGIGLIGGPGAQRGMNLNALQQNFISAYDDMVATGAKVASGYYKTAGMAAIHMNKATARCGAAFLMYSSSYAKMLSSIIWSIYKSSVVTLGTSWRTAVM